MQQVSGIPGVGELMLASFPMTLRFTEETLSHSATWYALSSLFCFIDCLTNSIRCLWSRVFINSIFAGGWGRSMMASDAAGMLAPS